MSKKCMVRRETRRTRLVKKFATQREALRVVLNDPSLDLESKLEASSKLQKLPKDSTNVRQRRRCWMTGRAHGVYRFVGICRNMFRIHAMQGDIPGITKASW